MKNTSLNLVKRIERVEEEVGPVMQRFYGPSKLHERVKVLEQNLSLLIDHLGLYIQIVNERKILAKKKWRKWL